MSNELTFFESGNSAGMFLNTRRSICSTEVPMRRIVALVSRVQASNRTAPPRLLLPADRRPAGNVTPVPLLFLSDKAQKLTPQIVHKLTPLLVAHPRATHRTLASQPNKKNKNQQRTNAAEHKILFQTAKTRHLCPKRYHFLTTKKP